jgi:hypothetical protein
MGMEFWTYVLDSTGPVAVALLLVYFQQQNHAAYMKREAENAQAHREDKARLFDVIANNTASNTRLIVLIERAGLTQHAANYSQGTERHPGGDKGGD